MHGSPTRAVLSLCAAQVLDTFLYADKELLQQQPELADAAVYVHFESSDKVR